MLALPTTIATKVDILLKVVEEDIPKRTSIGSQIESRKSVDSLQETRTARTMPTTTRIARKTLEWIN